MFSAGIERVVQFLEIMCFLQVSKELYSSLDDESQYTILLTLFDVCADTQQLMVADLVRKTLKHVS